MTFKIKQRNENAGQYGVTPFDDESGESLSDLFGTKIFKTLDQALAYAETQVSKIRAMGDEAAFLIVAN